MTSTFPPASQAPGDKSIMVPPSHIHLYQDEYFNVLEGKAAFWLGLSPDPSVVIDASVAGDKRTVHIPARRYHRFDNASDTDSLTLQVRLRPENSAQEERLFRNFFGYLDDCTKAKKAPSVFQLMVFLYAADTPIALPVPNEKIGLYVSWGFSWTLALIGRWVLGYQVTYAEYYME